MISHLDNVASTGFVEHLKLPHYVDFQAELGLIRKLRAEHENTAQAYTPLPTTTTRGEVSAGDPGKDPATNGMGTLPLGEGAGEEELSSGTMEVAE